MKRCLNLYKFLLKRKRNSDKRDYGHVLVLAGSRGMSGASILCANACVRSGAGLVTLAVPQGLQKIVARNLYPEIMTLPLPETHNGSPHIRAFDTIKNFADKRKITAMAIGPGISTHPSTKTLVLKIIKNISLPGVLDADGLNAISGGGDTLKKSKMHIIVTPHAGELSRLTGTPVAEIQKNRHSVKKAAMSFARKNKIVCVLKGHRTVVSDGKNIHTNTTGNPGMATGGSGDVLTGIISAFISQARGKTSKEKLFNAAVAGVFVHGLAGDMAAKEKTQIGMTPSDIIEKIPSAIRHCL
ncbi:MAG: NAD(P)H-hydrate dehydratase [Elusimicrobiota bacterium]